MHRQCLHEVTVSINIYSHCIKVGIAAALMYTECLLLLEFDNWADQLVT